MADDENSPYRLYRQSLDEKAAGGHDEKWRVARYRELMVEAGHIIRGTPEPLPCGWSPKRRSND